MVAAASRSLTLAFAAACSGGGGAPSDAAIDARLHDAGPYQTVIFVAVQLGVEALAVGDLDGDGKPDLAVTAFNGNSVSVFLNTTVAGGALSFGQQAGFEAGQSSFGGTALAIGDLDGDGKPDLAVAGQSAVSVLLNTTLPGDSIARLSPSIDFPAAFGTGAISVALADFHGDGKLDVVVAYTQLLVLFHNTTAAATVPAFAPPAVIATDPTSLFDVHAADFDGDGRPDLAVLTGDAGATVLLDTSRAGSHVARFAAGVGFAAGPAPTALALGDFDGDGKPDLAVTSRGSPEVRGNTVSLLLDATAAGASTPSFTRAGAFANPAPIHVHVADLDGDGRPDLVMSDLSGDVTVLLNTTPAAATVPSFAPRAFLALDLGDLAAVVDLDGDGRPELVVTRPQGVYIVLAR